MMSIDELLSTGFGRCVAEYRTLVGARPVSLCFGMDVIDPSCAPGVCTPSWGGPSAREGIDPMRYPTGLNIVAVDIDTVSPPQDASGKAAHRCVHMIHEALAMLCRRMGLAQGRRRATGAGRAAAPPAHGPDRPRRDAPGTARGVSRARRGSRPAPSARRR
jgi:hypothetical protein